MAKHTIAVILGSVRTGRLGIRAARFVMKKLKAKGHNPILIDPMVYKLPLLNKMYKEYPKGKAPATLEKVAKIIKKADGYMIVTAEYNHGYPPALKNMLDHFLGEYSAKPSAIVSYSPGPFGGVRAAVALRAPLCEMGMPSISSMFPISRVHEALDEKGNTIDKAYDRRIEKFMKEFEWYLDALAAQRKKGMPS